LQRAGAPDSLRCARDQRDSSGKRHEFSLIKISN
jgi:hypothetical protein